MRRGKNDAICIIFLFLLISPLSDRPRRFFSGSLEFVDLKCEFNSKMKNELSAINHLEGARFSCTMESDAPRTARNILSAFTLSAVRPATLRFGDPC